MTATTLALSRRTYVERKVLSLLRGGDEGRPLIRSRSYNGTTTCAESMTEADRYFGDLRRHVARLGLRVQPPATPYVTEAELMVLSWLAQAQRVAGFSSAPADAALLSALAGCAGLLDGMGLRLSPLTLYGARFHAPTPAATRPA